MSWKSWNSNIGVYNKIKIHQPRVKKSFIFVGWHLYSVLFTFKQFVLTSKWSWRYQPSWRNDEVCRPTKSKLVYIIIDLFILIVL